jgi:hypothetical protein
MAAKSNNSTVALHLTLILSWVVRNNPRETDFQKDIREAKNYMLALERLRPSQTLHVENTQPNKG